MKSLSDLVLFRRKRKQCKDCLKTFYKPVRWWITTDGLPQRTYWSDRVECPYCGGDWIVV